MSIVAFAVTLLASYCCIGAAIKLVDEFHDNVRLRGHSILPWTTIVATAVLVNIWVFIDPYTDGLALALLLALAATRKVDNRHFLALAIITLPFILLSLLRVDVFVMVLPLLLALAPAAVIDEVLDAAVPHLGHASVRFLARCRPVMKIVVLVLPFLNVLTVFHAIGFWGFDVAYALVGYGLRAPVHTP